MQLKKVLVQFQYVDQNQCKNITKGMIDLSLTKLPNQIVHKFQITGETGSQPKGCIFPTEYLFSEEQSHGSS